MNEEKVMTPAEFAKEMQDLYEYKTKDNSYIDQEIRHIEMDNLMCKVLRQLGYGEGVDIFEITHKWYA